MRTRSLLLVGLSLAACARGPAPETAPASGAGRAPARPAPTPVMAATWTLTGRATAALGASTMVVSGHPLANEVGLAVLRRGGNAVDAAVAIGFALAVVLPEAGNIGGGGFMIIREANGTVRALDYRETAPASATRDMYVDASGRQVVSSTTGHLAVGVPGSVAGLWAAHRRYGTLPWGDLVAPAVRLARDGHVVDSIRSRVIAGDVDRLRRFPASRRQFLLRDQAIPPGSLWKQADLAKTLQVIADSGADGFYRGSIADLIVAEMARGHGLVTKADLAGYRAKWRDPLQLTYRRHRIYTMPPVSGGGITLGLMLNMMEREPALPPFGSAALLDLEARVMRRAYADRNSLLGDPDFVAVPIERLTSKSYAARLRAEIDSAGAGPAATGATPHEGSETIHYAVVDPGGNAVSCTTTIDDLFGSAVTVTGAGFLLNDEMDDFTTAPGQATRSALSGVVQGEANAIAPGKRMLSSMTPSIVLDPRGRLLLLVGGRGGTRITSSVFHVISNVIDHDLPLADAVAAPRAHHQASPDSLEVERGGFLPATLDSLRTRRHAIRVRGYVAQVAAILRTSRGWLGVGDPRGGGAALGY